MQTAYKSIRLFQASWLEWFSHIHPLTPLVVWGPVSAYFIWRGFALYDLSVAGSLGMGVLALLAWSLTEYVLHRIVFHYEAKGEFQERLFFIMHGIHHADPVDPTRLVMPPVVSLILAGILYPVFRLAAGPAWVNPFFGFFLIGYLTYDYTHYAVHHFTPRTRWGKMLKQNHMIHHYVNHDVRWGVSSPLWDYVFGTLREPVPVKAAKKPAAKTPQTAAQGLAREAAAANKPQLNRA